jgi:DedD protein
MFCVDTLFSLHNVDAQLKRRLVGAVVLVSLAVIFLPMMLQGRDAQEARIEQTNIPPKPSRVQAFKSSVMPVADDEPLIPPLDDPPPALVPIAAPVAPAMPARESAAAAPSAVSVKPPRQLAAEPEPETTAVPEPKVGIAAWVVQVVSLSNRDNAERLIADLRKNDFPAFMESISIKGKTLFRVRVGPEIDRQRADAMAEKIQQQFKLKGQVIRYP